MMDGKHGRLPRARCWLKRWKRLRSWCRSGRGSSIVRKPRPRDVSRA